MHACGHDAHTTMLLGAAQEQARPRRFDGTLVLIFQPAEEYSGGHEMVRDGLFERFPVDAVFGLHNMPGIAPGHFAASAGSVLTFSNEFQVLVQGKGGHGAMPHLAIDPLPITAQML